MSAYDSLSTFPDVEPALKALAEEPSIVAYVFSNGTDSMVSSSVTKSPSLAPYANIFKELITVEDVGAYKPHPRVYEHLVKKAGKGTSKAELETIWLVSGNPFDIVGAKAVGLNAVWVDRAGGHHGNGGWNDRLGELASGGPTVIVKGLDDAVKAIKKLTEDRRMNGEESKTDNSSGAGLNHEAAAMGPG
jgi:2-haloacid dehalogenase